MDVDLKNIVDGILKNEYENKIPLKVKNRCQEELKKIEDNGENLNYFLAYKICQKANDDRKIIIDRVAGSSYVAYLLGITFVNPLECDIFWQKNITFDLECNEYYLDELRFYARKLLENYKLEGELKNYNIYLNSIGYAKDPEKWEIVTGKRRWNVNIIDDTYCEYLNSNNIILSSGEKEIVAKIPVDNIDTLAKVILFERSTIFDKEDYIELLRKKMVISREDLFYYLVHHGMDEAKAWEITLFIGKKLVKDHDKWLEYQKLMKSLNVPKDMVEYFSKIVYLYPKAYGYNRAIIYLWLIYYETLNII